MDFTHLLQELNEQNETSQKSDQTTKKDLPVPDQFINKVIKDIEQKVQEPKQIFSLKKLYDPKNDQMIRIKSINHFEELLPITYQKLENGKLRVFIHDKNLTYDLSPRYQPFLDTIKSFIEKALNKQKLVYFKRFNNDVYVLRIDKYQIIDQPYAMLSCYVKRGDDKDTKRIIHVSKHLKTLENILETILES